MDYSDLLLILLGFAVGAFGTIVGAGGGFVLVPVLLFLYPEEDPETITSISLLVVFANAVSGSIAFSAQRRIDYSSGLWFAAGTLPGAVVGAVVIAFVPRRAFDAIFALTLGAIGLYLLLRRNRTAIRPPVTGRGVASRKLTDSQNQTFVYSFRMWQGVIISTFVGFISSLLGIGGGVLQVPILVTVLHFPVHIATATSQFVLAFMAGQGNLTHVATGALGWDVHLLRAVLLSLGAIPGAQAGALLARHLHSAIIIRVLAVSLVIVALRLGLKAWSG